MDDVDERELDWLRACWSALWRHVNHDHAIAAHGNANQLEAIHKRVHRVEGTAWHDAWRLPRPTEGDQPKGARR